MATLTIQWHTLTPLSQGLPILVSTLDFNLMAVNLHQITLDGTYVKGKAHGKVFYSP